MGTFDKLKKCEHKNLSRAIYNYNCGNYGLCGDTIMLYMFQVIKNIDHLLI